MNFLINPYRFINNLEFIITVGQEGVESVTTRKYDFSGNEITVGWPVSSGNSARGVAVDSNNNIITGGGLIGNLTTRKYDSDGNLIWSRNHGAQVFGVAVDGNNNIITGGSVVGNLTTRKYDSDGTLLWSVNHNQTVFGIAVSK